MTGSDLRLFDLPGPRAPTPAAAPASEPGALVVRVLPMVAAIDKEFDYLVPEHMYDEVRLGTVVRIELHGRRVGAWVTAVGVDPTPGVVLRPIAKVTGWGPPADVVDLATWASWRWAGKRASLLSTATHHRAVPSLPVGRGATVAGATGPTGNRAANPVAVQHGRAAAEAFAAPGVAVVRLPPGVDTFDLVAAAAGRDGNALILAPSVSGARHLGLRLRRAGLAAAILPNDWPMARAGSSAVGSRAAAWAPVIDLGSVVVLDEHDEVYQEERAPTWHARDVAVERARRAGVPCVLVSPSPTLEALSVADRVVEPSRQVERAGWPMVDVVDMRGEDPMRGGLISERLAGLVQEGRRVVCVLNRKGRAKQIVCPQCQALARCERCQAAVGLDSVGDVLRCARCGAQRPVVCDACGATRLKQLRVGVTSLRDDLAVLTVADVVEVVAAPHLRGSAVELPEAQVYVGTEAVLHQVRGQVDVVAFVDLDQELTMPRYRATEQAFTLLIRAARVLGGRAPGGRLLLQTRLPGHEVVQAAVHADPNRMRTAASTLRDLLRFPPFAAMAAVSGAAAESFIASFSVPSVPVGIDVLGPADGVWLLRAPDHKTLCDALAAATRPPGRLRIEVDPLRV